MHTDNHQELQNENVIQSSTIYSVRKICPNKHKCKATESSRTAPP